MCSIIYGVSCETELSRLPTTFSPSRQHNSTLACCILAYKPPKAVSTVQYTNLFARARLVKRVVGNWNGLRVWFTVSCCTLLSETSRSTLLHVNAYKQESCIQLQSKKLYVVNLNAENYFKTEYLYCCHLYHILLP